MCVTQCESMLMPKGDGFGKYLKRLFYLSRIASSVINEIFPQHVSFNIFQNNDPFAFVINTLYVVHQKTVKAAFFSDFIKHPLIIVPSPAEVVVYTTSVIRLA